MRYVGSGKNRVEVRAETAWRELLFGYALPKGAHKLFTWLDESDFDNDGFFRYQNTWYHLSMFSSAPRDWAPWTHRLDDSFFSGVLLRLELEDDGGDGSRFKVATFFAAQE